jgi:PmbA protein
MSWQLYENESRILQIKYENSELSSVLNKELSGKNLRMIENGKIARVSGDKGSSLDSLLKTAADIVPYGKEVDFDFPQDGKFHAAAPIVPNTMQTSAENWVEYLNEKNASLKSKFPHVAIDYNLICGQESHSLQNSFGLNGQYSEHSFDLVLMLKGCQENDIFMAVSSTSKMPDSLAELDKFFLETEQYLEYGRNISTLKPGRYPVLFSPEAVSTCLQVIQAGFSANALENKTSPLLERVNQKILHESISLTENAEYIPFDFDGIASQRKTFIENGVLKTLPIALQSAKKLEREANGAQMLSAHGYSSDLTMSNGNQSYKDLLANMEEGLLLTLSADLTQGNIINGDMSGTVTTGYHVKDGKILGRVKNNSISFNFYESFSKNLMGLSSEVLQSGDSGYVRVPWALVDDISC